MLLGVKPWFWFRLSANGLLKHKLNGIKYYGSVGVCVLPMSALLGRRGFFITITTKSISSKVEILDKNFVTLNVMYSLRQLTRRCKSP